MPFLIQSCRTKTMGYHINGRLIQQRPNMFPTNFQGTRHFNVRNGWKNSKKYILSIDFICNIFDILYFWSLKKISKVFLLTSIRLVILFIRPVLPL